MNIVKFDHHYDIIHNNDYDIYRRKEYLDYRENWLKYPEKKYVSNYPLNIDIAATTRCNLKCVMCNRTKSVELGLMDKFYDMELALYKKIIDEAAHEGVCAVHITGEGEPLLHKNIIEMIEYANKKNIPDLFMHTNGTLLNKDMSLAILKAGLTRLLISIDSPERETYESIRVGASFETVLNNVITFAELKKQFKYPILRVQMVKMRNNYFQEKEYEKLFKPYVDELGYSNYVNFFGHDDDSKEFQEKQFREEYVCEDLWRRMMVNANGDVYACFTMPKTLLLGNAHKSNLKELWHGKKMSEIRGFYKRKDMKCIKEICTCGFQWK